MDSSNISDGGNHSYHMQLGLLVIDIGDVYSYLGISHVGLQVLCFHCYNHLVLPLVVEVCFHGYTSGAAVDRQVSFA